MFGRNKIFVTLFTVAALATIASVAMAGPYSVPLNDPTNPHDAPISKNDVRIVEWANKVEDYSPAPGVGAGYQTPGEGYGCLGDLYDPANPPATGTKPDWHGVDEVFNGNINDTTDSYGFIGIDNPGTITVSFTVGIRNGVSHDFAVFENGFTYGSPNGLFSELAYVEVSSDGVNFARFDSISTNAAPVTGGGAFAGYDTTNIYNLAGKNASGWGTPFDLDELTDHSLVTGGNLDLNDIQYVRLVDIPGNGSFLDSEGNGILDNWITENSSGYDFRLSEGVGVINQVPEPATMMLLTLGGTGLAIRRRRR